MNKQIDRLWDSRFKIQKSSGYTWVYVPSKASRILGQTIKKHITSNWKTPEYFYHLRSGGHIAAMNLHLNNQYFASIDLKQFFSSLSLSRVTRVLKKYWPYHEARQLAKSSVVKCPDDKSGQCTMLPFGFIQSPIIASLCLEQSHLGTVLNKLNEMTCLDVSVYVDDIIISGNSIKQLEEQYSKLLEAVEKSALKSSESKNQVPSTKVSVFNILLRHNFLEIESYALAEFHHKYKATNNHNIQNGILRYVMSVCPNQAKLLIK